MAFDWATLAFQTVNVALLTWLLSRVFWRPVSAMIAARKAEAGRILAEAEAAQAAARSEAERVTAERKGIDEARREILAAARAEAEADRSARLDRAEAEERDLAREAEARREAEWERAEAAYGARAADLAVEMAKRIGRALDGPELRAAALERLAVTLAALPEADRAAFRAAEDVYLTTATRCEAAECAGIAVCISAALGGEAAPAFATDPDLVAGLSIAAPHMVVAETWAGRLEDMRREIERDD